MRKEIFEDEYGYDAWDVSRSIRCYFYIINSTQWKAATGKEPPGYTPNAADYTNAGLPWFDHYKDNVTAMNGAAALAGLASVKAKSVEFDEEWLFENDSIETPLVMSLGSAPGHADKSNTLATHQGK